MGESRVPGDRVVSFNMSAKEVHSHELVVLSGPFVKSHGTRIDEHTTSD